ncbi:MAG TPA: DUF5652 family protein [Dehalococcoidia bacterium]|nr:DUF5652 family protein [Dehalococcoidia bacterium]
MSRHRRIPAPLWPFVLADIVLRVVAVTRALRLRQTRWALALALVSSAGVLPALYLLQYARRADRSLP